MKIKVAKDYWFDQLIYECDMKAARNPVQFGNKTYQTDYSSQWEEEDVTAEQLLDYIKQGYAIKINC